MDRVKTTTPGGAGRCRAVWVTTKTRGYFFLTVSTTVVWGLRFA